MEKITVLCLELICNQSIKPEWIGGLCFLLRLLVASALGLLPAFLKQKTFTANQYCGSGALPSTDSGFL